jgi:hypothetical protein
MIEVSIMDNKLAQVHFGVAVGIASVALRGGGWAMWVLSGFSTLFFVSAILLSTKIEPVKKLLRKASVDFLPLFLGLVLFGLVLLEKVFWIWGTIVEVMAFLYLYIRLYQQVRAKAKN